MSGQKDVLQRLKTALARSAGGVTPGWGGSDSPLSRRNEAKRALLRDGIAEIERLRAERDAPDIQVGIEQAKRLPPLPPTPLCRQIGVAWSEVPP